MKKSTLLIIGIIVVAIVAIILFSGGKNKGAAPFSETPSQPQKETGEKLNLLAPNVSYQCTYRIEENLEVTTFVKNGKIRTEINLPTGDKNVSLYADNKVYQWSEKEKQGFFMTIDFAKQQPQTEIQEPEKYLDDIVTRYKPDCKRVNLADSLFVVPTDVKFQDMSQLLNLSK